MLSSQEYPSRMIVWIRPYKGDPEVEMVQKMWKKPYTKCNEEYNEEEDIPKPWLHRVGMTTSLIFQPSLVNFNLSPVKIVFISSYPFNVNETK